MAHNIQQKLDDLASATKKAFSAEEMLKNPNSEEDRLKALTRQLGLSPDDIAALSGHQPSGDAAGSSDGVSKSRSFTRRSNTSPELRAERNKAAQEAARQIADSTRMGSTEEVPSSVRVRRFQQMSTREQIWAIMDDPTSSRAAQIIAGTIMVMILVSCVAFVVQTLPEYVNDESTAWSIIEDICIAVFTLEFVLRMYATPSRLAFVKSPLNIIDFLAIAPFYVELVVGANSSGSQVIRLIRLVRIFRIFKISRYLPWVRVFTNALSLSLQPLIMLLLVVMIAMVLFSSVIYYAERGEWSEADAAWMRQTPDGPVPSPYQSIPVSFWWCIVTMTTVGYGDMFPVTTFGRFIAALAGLSGILVVAIPVSVISTNFNGEYAKLLRQREQVRARMMLLKRQFRESKTGLEAVLDEVDDIVTRNTQELESEINTLFDQARVELTEELSEILKMAYERRRQLHLAALAAGKVQSTVVASGPPRPEGATPVAYGLDSATSAATLAITGLSATGAGGTGGETGGAPSVFYGSGAGTGVGGAGSGPSIVTQTSMRGGFGAGSPAGIATGRAEISSRSNAAGTAVATAGGPARPRGVSWSDEGAAGRATPYTGSAGVKASTTQASQAPTAGGKRSDDGVTLGSTGAAAGVAVSATVMGPRLTPKAVVPRPSMRQLGQLAETTEASSVIASAAAVATTAAPAAASAPAPAPVATGAAPPAQAAAPADDGSDFDFNGPAADAVNGAPAASAAANAAGAAAGAGNFDFNAAWGEEPAAAGEAQAEAQTEAVKQQPQQHQSHEQAYGYQPQPLGPVEAVPAYDPAGAGDGDFGTGSGADGGATDGTAAAAVIKENPFDDWT